MGRTFKLGFGLVVKPGQLILGHFLAPVPVHYAVTAFLPRRHAGSLRGDIFYETGVPTSGDDFMRGLIGHKDLT
jgi:hypothetical protein